jgi:hypothetical protein
MFLPVQRRNFELWCGPCIREACPSVILISAVEAESACRFDGFEKLPFDRLRVCDTASRLKAPSGVEGLALAATRSRNLNCGV